MVVVEFQWVVLSRFCQLVQHMEFGFCDSPELDFVIYFYYWVVLCGFLPIGGVVGRDGFYNTWKEEKNSQNSAHSQSRRQA